MTQGQLASATALARSALAKIENGARRVTALELSRIAVALDERIEWFVADAVPAIVSHRNVMDPGAASPTIDRLVERTTRHVEFVLQHDQHGEVADLPQLERPATVAAAERAARTARDLLGYGSAEPALGLAEHATAAGILTFSFALEGDAADAASILLPRGAVVVVNGARHVGRRRLALAHDIGHCLFADEYVVDVDVSHHDEVSWEGRLDRFARALLLPGRAVTRAWNDWYGEEGARTAAVVLASMFRVDMSTLSRRLVELGEIDAEQAGIVRSARTTRADIVERDLVVHDELRSPELPRVYEQAVLRLYRNSTLSAARATDLLFDLWTEEDLPVLPPAPPDSIWGLIS